MFLSILDNDLIIKNLLKSLNLEISKVFFKVVLTIFSMSFIIIENFEYGQFYCSMKRTVDRNGLIKNRKTNTYQLYNFTSINYLCLFNKKKTNRKTK